MGAFAYPDGLPTPRVYLLRMPSCPDCAVSLQHTVLEGATTWGCANCHGVVATLPVVRRYADEDAVDKLQHRARRSAPEHRGCPFCREPLHGTVLASGGSPIAAAACLACDAVWFAEGGFAKLTQEGARDRVAGASDPGSNGATGLSPKAALAMAQLNLEHGQRTSGRGRHDPPDDVKRIAGKHATASWADGRFGVVLGRPVTFALAIGLIVTAIVWGLDKHAAPVAHGLSLGGLFTGDPVRWITFSIVSVDAWRLALAVYVLWVFGGRTERIIGPLQTTWLLVLGQGAGVLMSLVAYAGRDYYLVGPAGACGALLTWLAITCPRDLLGLDWYRQWPGRLGRIDFTQMKSWSVGVGTMAIVVALTWFLLPYDYSRWHTAYRLTPWVGRLPLAGGMAAGVLLAIAHQRRRQRT